MVLAAGLILVLVFVKGSILVQVLMIMSISILVLVLATRSVLVQITLTTKGSPKLTSIFVPKREVQTVGTHVDRLQNDCVVVVRPFEMI